MMLPTKKFGRTTKLPALLLAFVSVSCLWASMARAEDMFVFAETGGSGTSIGLGKVIDKQFAVRGSIGAGSTHESNNDFGSNRYDMKADASANITGMLDWYPFAESGFRLSTGAMYSDNRTTRLNAMPNALGNYQINGNSYGASSVGQLQGQVTSSKFAPLLAIGWESARPDKAGWRFISDMALRIGGTNTTTLTASDAASNAVLARNLAAEQKRVSSDYGQRTLSLGINIGAAYSF